MLGLHNSRIMRYAEAILTSELGDWIVSQLPKITGQCSEWGLAARIENQYSFLVRN